MKLKLSTLFPRILDGIEVVGNRLPHPATLFLLLAMLVAGVSWIGHAAGMQATHPVDGSIITTKSLLNLDGVRWIYENVTKNFVDFPPLGLVLVCMIGIGVAEGSGLFTLMIRALVIKAPKRLVTAAIVASAIVSHLASEAGYVVLIPLGAAVFHALGRHPIAGLAAAFCGVSGGFGANFLIGSVDPVLAGLSQSAAQILDPQKTVNPTVNFYFMFVSAIVIVILGTWITERFVEPRLGAYTGNAERIRLDEISAAEKRGLLWASLSLLVILALLALSVIPENGVLRDPKTGDVLRSPFFHGIITAIVLFFFIPGLVYGLVVRTIKNDKDLMKHIIKSMSGMGTYIVLVFFAAQFVAFFRYSNLGIILAIDGATALRSINLTGIPLLICFVVLSAFINLFMGSASAKWAIMAPVFVPMFMLLGYDPALTQAAFRIGDSITNPITPMMSYFALIVAFAQKYDEQYGVGTIIATMVPYTVIFGIFWSLLLVIWMAIGLPLGPGGPLYLAPG
jgi:aminobenzoyl-glutamate transport protein